MSRFPVKRERERRARPQKQKRLPERATRAQIHYIKPDPTRPHRVKVYLSPTRAHMRMTIRFIEGSWKACPMTMGMVFSFTSRTDGRSILRPGQIVARMFLNADDLRAEPADIISHESTHAAMAWVRLRRENLKTMASEEVLCYAVGRMTKQVNRIGYVAGVWR